MVLLSHGTGGSALDLAWLAEPLAEAGYLVAGVDHHGNNSVDGYLPEGFVFAWERPRDLAFLLRELERERDIGPVGTAGFSLGGFTAAAMVGARLAPDRLRAVVRGLVPVPPLPEFPDLLAALHTRVPDDMLERLLEQSGVDTSLPQVRAAFLICPAIGQLVDEESLAGIDRPVAIRWGGADDNAPGPENALRYGEFIPGADVRSAGEDVGHYAFANDDAADAPVRARVAADAVEFFTRHLPTGPQF
ncbi:serine aminopeptidase domain-containing protein [Streptomyces sp. RKAG293]|uniref:alpha/beta hydrolase family protein n=1 Tax=Streptomyces sp. RKAG293 TaxID=2893403 RepID=UPI002034590F|nr:alpha/beta hydrolase [Streptomyces sp. RKAG293]MCM2423622.1 alpha/beta hydrolase [Streptomyces sp. RKAG293]